MPPLQVSLPILLALVAVAVIYAAMRRKRASIGLEFPLAADALLPEAAEKAVERARARFNITLDYSVFSIHQLDDIFFKLRDVRASSPDLTDPKSLAFVFGAYLGETIRLNHPGFLWQRETIEADYQLRSKDAVASPIEWCAKRLAEGESPTLWQQYEVVTGQAHKARAAGASKAD